METERAKAGNGLRGVAGTGGETAGSGTGSGLGLWWRSH